MRVTGKQLSEAFAVFNKATTIINATGVSEKGTAKARSLALTAIETLQQIIARVSNVEDIVGQPGTPCPVQSQFVIGFIRNALGIEAFKEKKPEKKKAEKVAVTDDNPMTLGKGPFVAEIVSACDHRDRTAKVLWRADKAFKTETAAEHAIIVQAKKLKHRTNPWVSHWITEDKEHILDYGSHSYYGCITVSGGAKK